MAHLTAVIGVVDSEGARVDAARADGSHAPIVILLGPGLEAGTSVENGGTTTVPISATVDATLVPRVVAFSVDDLPGDYTATPTRITADDNGVLDAGSVGTDVLITDAADHANDGWWTISDLGTDDPGGTPYVLDRTDGAATAAEIQSGSLTVDMSTGFVWALGAGWPAGTLGTTPLDFATGNVTAQAIGAALVDSSTGVSGGGTIGAVTNTATAANAIATLAARLETMRLALIAAGVLAEDA